MTKELDLRTLLHIIDLESVVEIYDGNWELIIRATVQDVLLGDRQLLNREVLQLTPVHSARENYIELMVY